MERKKVSSGNLRSIGYDPDTHTLEVEFGGGTVIQYSKVTAETYRRLMGSSSMASFFRDNIEEEYTAKRVR